MKPPKTSQILRGIRWRLGITFSLLMFFSIFVGGISFLLHPSILVWTAIVTLLWVISTLIGLHVAGEIASPLTDMTEIARRMAAGELDQRVKTVGRDEVAELANALNTLAANLQQTLDDITHERSRLSTVLRHMPNGILFISPSGRLLLSNPASQRLLQFDESAHGRPHLHVTQNYKLSEAIDDALQTHESSRIEVVLHHPEERNIEVILAPIFRNEKLRGLLVLLHDVTHVRRLTRLRTEFIANASHELRTPITSIKGFTETMLDHGFDDPEETRKYVEIIDREAERLVNIVQDLLILVRLGSYQITNQVHVHLNQIVERVVERLRPFAEKAGIELQWQVEKDPVITGDPDYLERMVLNLVENGIKYTPEGGRVRVETWVDEYHRYVGLTVSDTGIGIPKEARSRIFDRFYRVDRGRSRDKGGTGLGLSIVKSIVEAHRGKIEVDSVVGQGSTFKLSFPARLLETAPQIDDPGDVEC